MPFSGGVFTRTDGVYTGPTVFQQEAAANIDILAANLDTEAQDMAVGLSTTLLKDGTQILTANIPFAGFKITGYGTVSAPSARSDVPSYGQVQDGAAQWGGVAGGTANALTVTLAPILTAPNVAGARILFIASATNTLSATLNPNAQGAVTFNKIGSAGLTPLVGGEIVAGNMYEALSTGTVYVLLNPYVAPQTLPTAGITWVRVIADPAPAVTRTGYMANNSGGAFNITLPVSPANGDQFFFTDAGATWGVLNLTVAIGGGATYTIMQSATNLVCNVRNATFGLVFDSTDNDFRLAA